MLGLCHEHQVVISICHCEKEIQSLRCLNKQATQVQRVDAGHLSHTAGQLWGHVSPLYEGSMQLQVHRSIARLCFDQKGNPTTWEFMGKGKK